MFKPELSMVAMPADRCAYQLAKERSDAVIERAFAAIEGHDIAVSRFFVGEGQGVPAGDYQVMADGKVEKNPIGDLSACSEGCDKAMKELAIVADRQHAPNYTHAGVACEEFC